MNQLKKRILEISYKYKLSHLGSCITAYPIIDEIFKIKKQDEPFILSSGHAGLALYAVIEKYNFTGINPQYKAENIFNHHGVHPDRCRNCGIDCSTGSLGQGLPIAVGMALADRTKNVYCLISDGECAEGSIWEAIRIANDNKLKNLKIYLNYNGWGAYQKITPILIDRLAYFTFNIPIKIRQTNFDQFPFLKNQDAHYHVMTKEEYEQLEKVF